MRVQQESYELWPDPMLHKATQYFLTQATMLSQQATHTQLMQKESDPSSSIRAQTSGLQLAMAILIALYHLDDVVIGRSLRPNPLPDIMLQKYCSSW